MVWKTTLSFIAAFFIAIGINAQTPDLRTCLEPNGTSRWNCPSNNFTLDNVYLTLVDANGNVIDAKSCTTGVAQTAFVYLNYTSNANSSIHQTRVFADLVIEGEREALNVYIGEVAPANQGSQTSQIYGPFTWECGTELRLENILVVWKPSFDNKISQDSYECNSYGKSQCEFGTDTFIAAPLAVQFDYSICRENGITTVNYISTTNGGKAPYTIAWDFTDNGSVDNTSVNPQFTNTSTTAFTTELTVTDFQGTVSSYSVLINNPTELTVTGAVTNINCDASTLGEIDITISGGTDPFVVTWTGPNSYTSSSEDLSNLEAGIYSVEVEDKFGCTYSTSFEISQDQKPIAEAGNTAELTCLKTTLQLNGSGSGQGTLSYTWTTTDGTIDSGANTATPTVSAAGTYTLTITDADNGCSATDTVIITQDNSKPAAAIADNNGLALSCSNPSTTLTASGGVSYSWSNGSEVVGTEAELTVTTAGTFTVTVTGENGCTATASATTTLDNSVPVAAIANNNGLDLNCSNPSTTLTASGGVSYLWSNGATTASITVTTADTFTVTVTGENGCTATASATTTLDNSVPVAAIANNNGLDLNCSNPSTTLTASGGVSYSWSNGSEVVGTEAELTVTTAGTFTVTVTGENGCTATASATTTLDNSVPVAAIANNNGLDLNCSNPSTTLTASGGVSYLWSNGATTASITVTTADTFTVTVTGENGCTATASATTTLDNSVPVAAIANNNGLDLNCSNPSTTLTASGGVSYLWSNGATTASITVTTADTFTVTVTGENGCTATASVTTTLDNSVPVAAIANNNGLDLNCSNPSTTLTASGGVSYLWSNGATTASITVTTADTFTVTVTGENGCTATASVTTTLDNSVPVAAIANNNGLDLNCSNPSTTLTASGGVSYLWSNGATTPSITVTTADTFTVTVTGENGCTATASVTTTLDNSVPVAAIANNNGLDLNCSNPSTTLTASGGVSYLWSNGATTASITVTTADTFTVTVTGENGCTATASATTTLDNSVPVAAIANNNGLDLSCSNPSTTLTSSGGVSYLWSNGATTPSITVTTADTFTVTVTGENGCTATASVTTTLDNSVPVAAIANNNGLDLNCSNPSTTLTASGGVSYLWSNGATTPSITVTTADTFTVTVTGENGCTATASVTTTLDNSVPVAAIANNNGLDLNCSNPSTTLTASGGVSYLWSNGATTASITVTTADTFTVTVTGENGCTATASVTTTLDNSVPVAAIANNNGLDLNCSNPSTTLTASGGVSYLWSNGATTASITVTTADTFTVTVTGENGCTATASATTTLDNSVPVAAIANNNGLDLSCSNPSTTLTASGGVSYLWSNGATTPSITVTTADTFTVTVTGENGCTATASVTTTLDNSVPVAAIANNNGLDLNCSNPSTTLTASGGVSYLWSNGATTASITVTTADTFTVTVTGENGCTATASVTTTLDNSVPVAAIANNNGLDLNCSNPSTTLTASGGMSYLWSNGATTASITVTTADTFTVTVTGENGCTATASATTTLDNSVPVAAIANNNGLDLNCSNPSTTLTASGGVSYLWSNGATTASITVTTADTFTVTVTGENGCTATASATTTLDNSVPVAAIANNNGLDLNCSNPSTTLTASGGVSYLWSNGATTASITVTTADTFTVTVTGENGCTATASATTTLDNSVPVAAIANNNGLDLNCSNPSTTLTASGGVSYLWSNGATTASITVTTADTFTVTVTGENGCTATASVTIKFIPDTEAPVLDSISNITVNVDAGTCGAVVSFEAPTATDNCEGTVVTLNEGSMASGSVFPVGTTTVIFTATDASGNTTSVSFTVTVIDNEAPVADVAELPTVKGECSATVSVVPTATDNCGGTINGTTEDALTYTEQGTYTVTWTFIDGNGNISTQTQTVIVNDITAPVAVVAELPTVTGECSATVSVVPTATDNCGGTINGTTEDALTYTEQGTYTVTWTFKVGNGNTSTQTQTVIVDDITAPVVNVAELPTITGECSATVSVVPTATDNCGGTINGTTEDALTYTEQGTYTVTWTFIDGNGNISTQTQTVIVNDITAPVAVVAELPTVTGECSATVSVVPTATDNCGGTINGTTEDALTYTEQGTYTVTWTFKVGNGNTSTQTQTVIVDDITAPVVNVAELPTITGECSATVSVVPTATDNCGGTINGITEDALTYNEQGTYTLTWTFNDGNGNTSTQTQTVIVDDITAPVAVVAELPTVTGECSATVSVVPTATDNCGGTITGTTEDALTYTEQGTYTVTWTFNDGNGNTSTQTQTVIVDDVTAPVAVLPELPTVTGECSATVAVVPTATDNCGGTINGTTQDALTYTEQGTYTVNWTFNDGNGNTSTQTQTVIVDDITAPVANVAALPTVSGECSATVSVVPTATDNCGGTINGTTEDALTYIEQGTYTVTWTFDDGNGNTSTQTQTVIGGDVTAPIANVTELPTVTGECSATVSTVPTATDNCGGTINGTTEDALTYTEQGTYSVTWTFNDGNGNTSTQTQTVIVDDVTAPVAITIADATGECEVTVTAPTTSDNCSGTITGTTSNLLNYSEQGTYEVTWTFNDGNGNITTAVQKVIVNGISAPVVAAVIQPNCEVATGSFTVTTVDGLEYTIDGENFSTSGSFEGLEPGVYTVAAINEVGCLSPLTEVVINETTSLPAPAIATTVQPTCEITTGSFTVLGEEGILYSIDGTNYQAGIEFSDLVPGTYNVTAQNEAGCISAATVVTIEDSAVTEPIGDRSKSLCIEDETFDLFDLYDEDMDESGTWEDPGQTGALNGSIVDPTLLEIGNYSFTYVTGGDCPSTTTVAVSINDDCVVLDCDFEDIKNSISKVVTPGTDNFNDFFVVDEDRECGFTYGIQIFNRWGAEVYSNSDYDNDWNGYSNKSFTGSNQLPSGTYFYIIQIDGESFEPIQGYIYLGTK